jgi:hypothetical protein
MSTPAKQPDAACPAPRTTRDSVAGAPSPGGHPPYLVRRCTSSLAGFLHAYDVTHLDEDGTYGHWFTSPGRGVTKLLVVRDRWELG